MIARIAFPAMGSQMTAVLDTPDPQAVDVLEEVSGWFETWEQRFSRFRPDSELRRVNDASGEQVLVSREFAEVFENARWAAMWTGGLVTPAVYDALLAAGYRKSFPDLPTDAPVDSLPVPVPDLDQIGWDAEQGLLELPPGMHLDFGGIAKGWAAEQAVRRLEAVGDALVDAGGDIAMSSLGGPHPNKQRTSWRRDPWWVGVAKPFDPATLVSTLVLWGGGVATSGRDKRRWQQGGAWHHHLIDPRSGLPAETDVLTATVIAPSLVEAEAAAKCVLIAGSREGMAWLDQHPHLAAMLTTETGEVLYSPNFPAYEWKGLENETQAAPGG